VQGSGVSAKGSVMTACEAFVIHLARAVQRAEPVAEMRATLPWPTRVIEAVDGKKLGQEVIRRVYVEAGLFEPRYPFRLGVGEIACFMSHRLAWQNIVDRNLDFGMVFEDDVKVDVGELQAVFRLVSDLGLRDSFISLQTRPLPEGGVREQGKGGGALFRFRPHPLRCSGQIIGREAAQKLLDLSERFDRPVDSFVQMTWVTGIRTLCSSPRALSDWPSTTGTSTAQASHRKNLTERLNREVKRFVYRRKISEFSRR
jgi:glycosyl transferase family 25